MNTVLKVEKDPLISSECWFRSKAIFSPFKFALKVFQNLFYPIFIFVYIYSYELLITYSKDQRFCLKNLDFFKNVQAEHTMFRGF